MIIHALKSVDVSVTPAELRRITEAVIRKSHDIGSDEFIQNGKLGRHAWNGSQHRQYFAVRRVASATDHAAFTAIAVLHNATDDKLP